MQSIFKKQYIWYNYIGDNMELSELLNIYNNYQQELDKLWRSL